MRLKRSYARAGIMLNAVALVISIVLFFIPSSKILWQCCVWIALNMMVVSQIISFKYFRCPYCGKHTVVPQWSKSGTKHCNECGKLFVYDK